MIFALFAFLEYIRFLKWLIINKYLVPQNKILNLIFISFNSSNLICSENSKCEYFIKNLSKIDKYITVQKKHSNGSESLQFRESN